MFGRVWLVNRSSEGTEVLFGSGGRQSLVTLPPSVKAPPIGSFVHVVADSSGSPTCEVIGYGTPHESGDAVRWWRPFAQMPTRMERLLQRARILQAIRGVMDEEFLEVQVPQLIRGTCPDLHIDSFRAGEGYLTTSTEYQLKRMFVGGFERLYTLTQNFREGDVGSHHNPEFAMLEWARAYASLDDIERDAERVVQRALASIAPGVTHITHGTYRVQLLGAPWERLSVRDALRRHLGIQIDPEFSLASMQAEVIRAGIEIPEVYRTNAVDLVTLLLDRMQPRLGAEVPTFLVDWPVFLTTSAPPFPDRPTLAQRSELFIAGIEVADGFPFLSDADRQTALFVAANAGRRGHGKPAVTLDDRYLAALREGLPPGAGMAMGVDRLVMLLVGEQDIRNVLPFAWDER